MFIMYRQVNTRTSITCRYISVDYGHCRFYPVLNLHLTSLPRAIKKQTNLLSAHNTKCVLEIALSSLLIITTPLDLRVKK